MSQQETTGWQPIATAPRDNTRCLYYSPGGAISGPPRGAGPHMVVDAFSDEWPKARHQLPLAPYTHWMPLPEPPQ